MTTEQTRPERVTAAGAMAPYLMLAQRQLEANLRIATTWAAAMSAVSGSMLSHAPSATHPEPAIRTADPVVTKARSFLLINGPGSAATDDHAPTPYWTTNGSPTPSWPRWINEPPTVQPDLFDEAIELLIDDDIKTAS
ncbi:MAG: hypothetical protein ABWZ02_14080 [Nakamurella sp.]